MSKDAKECQYRQNGANHKKRTQKLLFKTCKASFESVDQVTDFSLAKTLKYLKLDKYKLSNHYKRKESIIYEP